mgnify:CR=1 FL=1
MNILLDTHCWLWWIASPEKLSDSSRQLIEKRSNNIYLSSASSWEIAIKYSVGKLQLPELPERFIPPRLARDKIDSLPINHVHALHVANLPIRSNDRYSKLRDLLLTI